MAVLNPHPIQYFAPLYAYWSAAGDLDLTVLYCSDWSLRRARTSGFGRSITWDIGLLDGYRSVFLGARARTRVTKGFFSLIVPEAWTELRTARYDAVILHGHGYAVCWLAFLAAKLSGTRVLTRAETHRGLARDPLRRFLRWLITARFYRHADACLAIGSENARFYRSLGIPESRISLVPYVVDNERFERASALSSEERRRLKAELGIARHRPVVLFASKFQRRKRPHDVLRAAAAVWAAGVEFTLVMVGDGEMRGELEAMAQPWRDGRVVFPGFINQTNLPRIYGIADVFVLPSEEEPWGLVVNEAMCSGLPVVVASGVGCTSDLVRHGDNGFLFEAGNVDALADALTTLLRDPGLRQRMGQRSLDIIRGWSFAQTLDGLRKALS